MRAPSARKKKSNKREGPKVYKTIPRKNILPKANVCVYVYNNKVILHKWKILGHRFDLCRVFRGTSVVKVLLDS